MSTGLSFLQPQMESWLWCTASWIPEQMFLRTVEIQVTKHYRHQQRGGSDGSCSLEASLWYLFNMTQKSALYSTFSSCGDLVPHYLRCLYLELRARRKAGGEGWSFLSEQWHIWELSWAGMVGSGDELSFLRMKKEVRTPQMKTAVTVEMRRMKKLMIIFAISWWKFSKQGMLWYVFTACLATDTRRLGWWEMI